MNTFVIPFFLYLWHKITIDRLTLKSINQSINFLIIFSLLLSLIFIPHFFHTTIFWAQVLIFKPEYFRASILSMFIFIVCSLFYPSFFFAHAHTHTHTHTHIHAYTHAQHIHRNIYIVIYFSLFSLILTLNHKTKVFVLKRIFRTFLNRLKKF